MRWPAAISALTLLLWLCTAAGALGTLWWFFDLFAHFRLQYTVLFLLCLALSLLGRHWRAALAALLGRWSTVWPSPA